MSTELVEVNLAEVHASDYLSAAFLDSPAVTREGVDGQYALAMAYHALNAGVDAAELRQVRDEIADENGPAFVAAGGSGDAPEQARESIRRAASRWTERCPELAELFTLAASLVTTWRAYSALLFHVDRISKQVAIISGLRKQA